MEHHDSGPERSNGVVPVASTSTNGAPSTSAALSPDLPSSTAPRALSVDTGIPAHLTRVGGSPIPPLAPQSAPAASLAVAHPAPPAPLPPASPSRGSPELSAPVHVVPAHSEPPMSPLSQHEASQYETDELESSEDDLPRASTSTSANAFASTSAARSPAVATLARRVDHAFAAIPLPHYTVTRSARNSKDTPHVLTVKPGVTDVGPNPYYPTGTTPGGKVKGVLNWYEAQVRTDGKYNMWLEGLGKELAEMLGENTNAGKGGKQFWMLQDWPDGYRFFCQHTPHKSSATTDRIDAYLYGSASAGCTKFRTVNEFAPHLHWLLTNGPTNPKQCLCKYCSRKTQAQVNQLIGLDPTRTGHDSPSAPRAPRPVSTAKKVEARAAKRIKIDDSDSKKDKRASLPAMSTASNSAPVRRPAKSMSPTYNGSYTSKERDKDLADGAMYRRGELVWVELDEPFLGIVEENELRLAWWPAIVTDRSIKSKSTRIAALEPGQPPSITNVHSFVYITRLLSCANDLSRSEQQMRPFLGMASTEDIITSATQIAAQESVKLVWDGRSVIRPRLDQMKDVAGAATPFALALQIAAHVNSFFCFEDRYSVNRTQLKTGPTFTVRDQAALDQQLDSWHYQCFYWGAERIWSGELVRVLVTPLALPEGTLPLSEGAQDRTLFCRLSSIYKDEVHVSGMISGTLFELKDVSKEPTAVEGGDATAVAVDHPIRSQGGYLPTPPPGYVFNCLTLEGEEIQVDIEFVAGRYHPLPPHLTTRQACDKVVEEVVENDRRVTEARQQGVAVAEPGLTEDQRRVTLAGLLPAPRLYVRCYAWVADRRSILSKAEKKAQGEMSDFLKSKQGHHGDLETTLII